MLVMGADFEAKIDPFTSQSTHSLYMVDFLASKSVPILNIVHI